VLRLNKAGNGAQDGALAAAGGAEEDGPGLGEFEGPIEREGSEAVSDLAGEVGL